MKKNKIMQNESVTVRTLRNPIIDILKGMLIILVVLGHAFPSIDSIIYQFHMPLFFIISGYFLTLPKEGNGISWIIQRVRRYMLPYFMYYVLITVLGLNKEFSLHQIVYLIFGGRMCKGVIGVWWFPTCMMVGIVITATLISKLKQKKKIFTIGITMYVCAFAESKYVDWQVSNDSRMLLYNFPMNIDVVLMVVPLLLAGVYLKEQHYFEEKQNKLSICICEIIALAILELAIYTLNVDHIVDMKYSSYGNIILFPVLVYLWLEIGLSVSSWVHNCLHHLSKFFESLGHHTMAIMYIHVPVIYLIRNIFGHSIGAMICACLLSISVSNLWGILCEKNKIMKLLFI